MSAPSGDNLAVASLLPEPLRIVRYRAQPLGPATDAGTAHRRVHHLSYRRAAAAAGREAALLAADSADPEAVIFRVVRISSIPIVEARGMQVGPVETRTISTAAPRGDGLGQATEMYAVRRHIGRLSRVVGVFAGQDEAWSYFQAHLKPGRRLSLEHQIHENVADITPVYYATSREMDARSHHEIYDGAMRQKSTVRVHVPRERMARAVRSLS
jgi:hypothetical protein